MLALMVLLAALGCGSPPPPTEPVWGQEFFADLDGDRQVEAIQTDYESVRIGALVTPIPKVQIDKPPVAVTDIALSEPHKELVIQAVDSKGVGVWHILLYGQGKVELYSIEVSTPPEVLGDGVLRTRLTECGETVVTDWARSELSLTQTRTERMGMYNPALCSG
jgi:hypothetical protein